MTLKLFGVSPRVAFLRRKELTKPLKYFLVKGFIYRDHFNWIYWIFNLLNCWFIKQLELKEPQRVQMYFDQYLHHVMEWPARNSPIWVLCQEVLVLLLQKKSFRFFVLYFASQIFPINVMSSCNMFYKKASNSTIASFNIELDQ